MSSYLRDITLVIILMLASVAALTACKDSHPQPVATRKVAPEEGKTIIALFDLSGSTLSFRQEYVQDFREMLSLLKYGDSIIVGQIVDDSLQSSIVMAEESIPRFRSNKETKSNPLLGSNPLIDAVNKEKLKKSEENQRRLFLKQHDLSQIRGKILSTVQAQIQSQNAPLTDILGAMSFSERILSARQGQKILIIFSDMVLETSRYNFTKENFTNERISQIIEQERSSGRLPNLSGVKIIVLGANADSQDRYFAIRNFWLKYYKTSGANLDPRNYGRKMPALILDTER